jgi:hypothetical protein
MTASIHGWHRNRQVKEPITFVVPVASIDMDSSWSTLHGCGICIQKQVLTADNCHYTITFFTILIIDGNVVIIASSTQESCMLGEASAGGGHDIRMELVQSANNGTI